MKSPPPPYPLLAALGVPPTDLLIEPSPPLRLPETPHVLVEGDNRTVLAGLLASGTVPFDVIYIDPPYNTQKNQFRYNDNRSHQDWLSFMTPRLLAARELLARHGVIFISIDDNEIAYLRLLCDQVFGQDQFVANFIWRKSHTVKNDKKSVSTQHEYVLCYAKDKKHAHFNREPVSDVYIRKSYRYKDAGGSFRTVPLHKKKNKLSHTVTAPNGRVWSMGWNHNQAGFQKLLDQDLVYWGVDGNACPTKKVHLKAVMDKTYGSMLDPQTVKYTGQGGKDLSALGLNHVEFLYAKPVDLVAHCLQIAARPDARVLDFFAGSGTTLEAVLRLNGKDGGQRRCVLVTNDEDNICQTLTEPRCRAALLKHKINPSELSVVDFDLDDSTTQ